MAGRTTPEAFDSSDKAKHTTDSANGIDRRPGSLSARARTYNRTQSINHAPLSTSRLSVAQATDSTRRGWTANKSEAAVGYATLYGDMAGGYAVLKDVYKTLVYRLARWRNREHEVIPRAIIEKAPSAELRPDQFDTDSLPPYGMLDAVL